MKNLKNISFTAVSAILITIIAILWYNGKQSQKDYETALETFKTKAYSKESGYKFYISRQKDTIRGMNQMIVSQKQAIEMGILTRKELKDNYLKEIQTVNELTEEIKILSKTGEYISI